MQTRRPSTLARKPKAPAALISTGQIDELIAFFLAKVERHDTIDRYQSRTSNTAEGRKVAHRLDAYVMEALQERDDAEEDLARAVMEACEGRGIEPATDEPLVYVARCRGRLVLATADRDSSLGNCRVVIIDEADVIDVD
jgi:hypothetical protein